MRSRCKPGDIAVFISGPNLGKLVHVDRAFIGDEEFDGTLFCKTMPGPAWVVTSLGGPLFNFMSDDTLGPKGRTTAPFNERRLRPLRNPKGDDQTMRWSAKPNQCAKGAVNA